MKIQPTDNLQFKMKQPIRVNKINKVIDKVELDNGSTFKSIKYYGFNGELTDKLLVLRDKFNNWVKSRLKSYKGKQVIKSVNSYKED